MVRGAPGGRACKAVLFHFLFWCAVEAVWFGKAFLAWRGSDLWQARRSWDAISRALRREKERRAAREKELKLYDAEKEDGLISRMWFTVGHLPSAAVPPSGLFPMPFSFVGRARCLRAPSTCGGEIWRLAFARLFVGRAETMRHGTVFTLAARPVVLAQSPYSRSTLGMVLGVAPPPELPRPQPSCQATESHPPCPGTGDGKLALESPTRAFPSGHQVHSGRTGRPVDPRPVHGAVLPRLRDAASERGFEKLCR